MKTLTLLYSKSSVYVILYKMLQTMNPITFKLSSFFVVCMQLECQGTRKSGFIINRIYTLGTSDEHILEEPMLSMWTLFLWYDSIIMFCIYKKKRKSYVYEKKKPILSPFAFKTGMYFHNFQDQTLPPDF